MLLRLVIAAFLLVAAFFAFGFLRENLFNSTRSVGDIGSGAKTDSNPEALGENSELGEVVSRITKNDANVLVRYIRDENVLTINASLPQQEYDAMLVSKSGIKNLGNLELKKGGYILETKIDFDIKDYERIEIRGTNGSTYQGILNL